MQQALNILQQYWGHKDFRAQQWPIIADLLQKKDVIALLPTGGGKSVCFQVPAMMQEGLCIVISPLIALMEDQVNALQNKDIKAIALSGGMSYELLDRNLDNCIYGNYKFLYLSPERLQQELVQERIKQMNVNLIAIDEAHCISQWGHDFRPAYRKISILKDLQPNIPFAALTATATTKVVHDIETELKLKNVNIHRKSFERKNIAYNVLLTEDKNYRLSQLLEDKTQTAIIYVRSRKATIEICEHLKKKGYKVTAFHGGLKNEEKGKLLADWLSNRVHIMAATTAFGMGIDKPDVRHVIHLNLPESLESYFQEAGRAGRDEKPAQATIITNSSDIPVLKNQFISTLPDIEDAKKVYRKLNSYFGIAYGEGENTTHDFNFSKFCAQYGFNSLKAYNTLQLLDRCSIIKLSQQFQKKTELQIIIPGKQLGYYLEKNRKFDNLVKTILRTYGGVFESKTSINPITISRKAGINEKEVLEILRQLKQDEIIDLDYASHDASITFLVPREDELSIQPFREDIQLYHKTKTQKVKAVLDYIENTQTCRSKQLLAYFGEKGVNHCGVCSVCIKATPKLTRSEMNEIYQKINTLLQLKECNSREIIEKVKHREEHVLKVLQLLVEKSIISRGLTNTYKISKK